MMAKISDFPRWFLETAAGQRELIDEEQSCQSERESLAEQLAAIRAEDSAAAKEAKRAIPKAEAALKKAQDSAAKAFANYRQTKADHGSIAFRLSRQIQDLERQLRSTSDPLIDAFLEAINDESKELCRERSISCLDETRYFRGGLFSRQVRTRSNLYSIRRRLVAHGRAKEAAEALRLTVDKDISVELDKLRAGLPEVEMETVTPAKLPGQDS
jgi:hypothetical protein